MISSHDVQNNNLILYVRLCKVLFNYKNNPTKINEKQLRDNISLINSLSLRANDLPFLAWFINEILKDASADNLIILCEDLNKHGLQFNVKAPFLTYSVSILTFASQYDAVKLIEYLVDKIELPDDEPIHPITVALLKKQHAVYKCLIANIRVYSKDTALTMPFKYLQQKYRNQTLCQLMLDECKEDINQVDGNGNTPLLCAIDNNNLEIFDNLINLGADPLVRLFKGKTIFHYIFSDKSLAWIKNFTDKYPEYKNYFYNTALMPRSEDDYTPLHSAIHAHNNDVVKDAIEQNLELVDLVDSSNYSLDIHAIASKNVSLLKYLYETLKVKSKCEWNVLAYCFTFELIDAVTFLNSLGVVDFASHVTKLTNLLFSMVIDEKFKAVKYILSQEVVSLDNLVRHNGVAHNLVTLFLQYKQFELIVEHDLFRKSNLFVFSKNQNNKYWLDVMLSYIDFQGAESNEEQERTLVFMRYLVDYLKENNRKVCLAKLNYFESLVSYSLEKGLIDEKTGFNDPLPLFCLWLISCYCNQQYSLSFDNISEEDRISIQDTYSKNIKQYLVKYKPDINQKNIKGQHLLAFLLSQKNINNQVKWLLTNITGFVFNNLDNRDSSLLQLACESQDLELISFCLNKTNLSITEARKDGLSALDLALRSKNTVICKRLIHKLSNKQWKNILKSLKDTEYWELLENNQFYGRPPKIKQMKDTSTEQETTLTPQVNEEPTKIIDSEDKLNYAVIIESVSLANLSLLKTLKHEKYQLKIQQLIEGNFLDIIAASQYKYSVIYQLLRFKGLKTFFEQHWFSLFKDVIERGDKRLLLLFLNQSIESEILQNFGWNILNIAFQLRHYDMLLMLLQHEKLSSFAYQENNFLLLNAVRQNITDIVFQLLTLQTVVENANVFENAPLKEAAKNNDLEVCEILLQIPCVVETLKANDYSFLKEVRENEQYDVIQLMRHNIEINEFFEKNYPEMEYDAEDYADGEFYNYEDESTYFQPSPNFMVSPPAYIVVNMRTVVSPKFVYQIINYPDHSIHVNFFPRIPNAYDFYDAILNSDADELERLLCGFSSIHPDFIFNLASFTVTHGNVIILQRLLDLSAPFFRSNLSFSNRLVCQVARIKNIPMLDLLLNYAPMQHSLAYYHNRLLRIMVRNDLIDHALYILKTSKDVRSKAPAINNAVLREAIVGGHIELVSELLKQKNVCKKINAFNCKCLRQAAQRGHKEIILLLLAYPSIMQYAMQQNRTYDNYIIAFVKQRLREWNSNNTLTPSQEEWLKDFSQYPALKNIINKFVDGRNRLINELVKNSLFKIIKKVEEREQPKNLSSQSAIDDIFHCNKKIDLTTLKIVTL